MNQERILIFENKEQVARIDKAAMALVSVFNDLYQSFKGLDIAEVTSVSDLYLNWSINPGQKIKDALIDKMGAVAVNNVAVKRDFFEQMIEMPVGTEQFVAAANAVRYQMGTHTNEGVTIEMFKLEGGRVAIDETVLDQAKEQYRQYADTQEEKERYVTLQQWADEANAMAERFPSDFLNKEMPLLSGIRYYPTIEGRRTSDELKGEYRPDHRFIKKQKA